MTFSSPLTLAAKVPAMILPEPLRASTRLLGCRASLAIARLPIAPCSASAASEEIPGGSARARARRCAASDGAGEGVARPVRCCGADDFDDDSDRLPSAID